MLPLAGSSFLANGLRAMRPSPPFPRGRSRLAWPPRSSFEATLVILTTLGSTGARRQGVARHQQRQLGSSRKRSLPAATLEFILVPGAVRPKRVSPAMAPTEATEPSQMPGNIDHAASRGPKAQACRSSRVPLFQFIKCTAVHAGICSHRGLLNMGSPKS
jgi:hypothetical protein